ncbi:hypothetical protein PM033_10625 [Halorubrum ezzemoulense]|uniref:hypothetical protein n=1 Tax=Halorubrum ezzemoulense TaxID=337243 RepID=UPI00233031CA|nr:hypothetical protein [Halorubrum ezzemoulense]MDB2252227.1 hypothetical protein [Halorubrum ezzemoulense]
MLGVAAIAALPMIRGYYFYGTGDPMTHLGWVKQILWGTLNMDEFFYPGLHLLAAEISKISGLTPRHSLNLTAWLFTPIWLVFCPLLVRELTNSNEGLYIGGVAALILTPLNPINVRLVPLPSAQMVFFLTVVLYLYFRFFTDTLGDDTAAKITLGTVLTSVVFYHPQQAINAIVLLGLLIVIAKIVDSESETIETRPLTTVIAVGVLLVAWITSKETFHEVFQNLTLGLIATIQGIISGVPQGSAGAGSASRLESARALGYNIPLLGLKFIGKTLVAGAAALLLAVSELRNKRISLPVRLLVASSAMLLFGGAFAGIGMINQVARYAGVFIAIGSIVGAVGLTKYINSNGAPTRRTIITILLCASIIISVPVMFQSPFVALYNRQVTESQYQGYETAFEYGNNDIEYVHLRSETRRFEAAIYGSRAATDIEIDWASNQGRVPDHFVNQSLPAYYDGARYISITDADRIREDDLYNGYRYAKSDFVYLGQATHRVVDTNGYQLYFLAENRSS